MRRKYVYESTRMNDHSKFVKKHFVRFSLRKAGFFSTKWWVAGAGVAKTAGGRRPVRSGGAEDCYCGLFAIGGVGGTRADGVGVAN
jgi:hypothetical protein